MTVFVLFVLIVGAGAPHLNGYGTWTDFGIGVGVLVGSVLLFMFRRVVQDERAHPSPRGDSDDAHGGRRLCA